MDDERPDPPVPPRGPTLPPPTLPPIPVEPLDDDPLARHGPVSGWRVLAGCGAYMFLSAAWFYFAYDARLSRAAMLGGWGLMTAALLTAALYLRVRHRAGGYGYGMLLALLLTPVLIITGFVLLIAGICTGVVPFRVN